MKIKVFIFIIVSSLGIYADDIETIDGTIYKNVTFVSKTQTTITFLYEDGGATIYFTDLPPNIQKKYGYDAAALKAEADKKMHLQELKEQQETAIETEAKRFRSDQEISQEIYKMQNLENETKGLKSTWYFHIDHIESEDIPGSQLLVCTVITNGAHIDLTVLINSLPSELKKVSGVANGECREGDYIKCTFTYVGLGQKDTVKTTTPVLNANEIFDFGVLPP